MAGRVDLGIEGLVGLRKIGSGGFAEVFEAEDQFGRRVAVKMLKELDERGRRRFERERSALGLAAGHPGIVTPFTAGYAEVGGQPYVVMELIEGGSLQDHLDNRGALPLGEAVRLVLSVALALGFSHGAGLVHKDVKPANILLTGSGLPKLTDFGIASIVNATRTTSVAYSPEYTPPEMFQSAGAGDNDPRDARSDLYSLAATLYALVIGCSPFHSTRNPAPAGYMARILSDPVPRTGHAGLDGFLAKAMAKDPADRYQTATEFIAALSALAGVDPSGGQGFAAGWLDGQPFTPTTPQQEDLLGPLSPSNDTGRTPGFPAPGSSPTLENSAGWG